MLPAMLLTPAVMIAWWVDISHEGVGGDYTGVVQGGLKIGILLFIFRELCFFGSFFWGFFHSSLTPCLELAGLWPPSSHEVFNPFQVPLLNTALLLTRGVTITWSHHLITVGAPSLIPLIFTIILGAYFSSLQALEYSMASYSLSDRVYGSAFFVATGFHGLHVMIGTIFLLVCMLRIVKTYSTRWRVLGYELVIWYWHFVDVVWLFLFTCFYCMSWLDGLNANR